MTTPDETRMTLKKVLLLLGAFGFFVLAIVMGIQTYQAWQSHSPLSNWKNGTMRYRAGCQLAFTFACMGAALLYFGLRTWLRKMGNDVKDTAEPGVRHVR